MNDVIIILVVLCKVDAGVDSVLPPLGKVFWQVVLKMNPQEVPEGGPNTPPPLDPLPAS
jgi:hypothetical protein